MEKIIEDARKLALSKKAPAETLLLISEKKALELCEDFEEADKNIVHIGALMMDIALKEALKEGRVGEHVQMSVKETEEFLSKYDLSREDKEKIINCVEAHHKDVPFTCIEAEICANADCYKFIHPRGFFFYLTLLGKRGFSFEECLDQAEKKLDEKRNILSLTQCKEELEAYYKTLKQFIEDGR